MRDAICQDVPTFLITFGSRSTPMGKISNGSALCNSNESLFDSETNETVCSKCGMVLHDNSESLGPEWMENILRRRYRAQEQDSHLL
jgi:hypothetical protein